MRARDICFVAGFAVAALLVCPRVISAGGDRPLPQHKTRKTDLKAGFVGQPISVVPAGHWAPVDVDADVPAVSPDVTCPLRDVLPATSQRVKELVTNLQQFTATERLDHAKLDAQGNPRGWQIRTFEYMVAISEIRKGILAVEEYRNGGASLDAFPAHLATMGLPAFALIFHPYYIEAFQMSCEGLGTWRGQPAWQIHFLQRSDRISNIRDYHVRGTSFPVRLKGRAWIAADSFQVVRLETDLMEPIKAIPLNLEHVVIEYSPVQFQKRRVQLWLPETAELFLQFRGHRYHRLHRFANFALFSVDVRQQIQDPKEPDPQP